MLIEIIFQTLKINNDTLNVMYPLKALWQLLGYVFDK